MEQTDAPYCAADGICSDDRRNIYKNFILCLVKLEFDRRWGLGLERNAKETRIVVGENSWKAESEQYLSFKLPE